MNLFAYSMHYLLLHYLPSLQGSYVIVSNTNMEYYYKTEQKFAFK